MSLLLNQLVPTYKRHHIVKPLIPFSSTRNNTIVTVLVLIYNIVRIYIFTIYRHRQDRQHNTHTFHTIISVTYIQKYIVGIRIIPFANIHCVI